MTTPAASARRATVVASQPAALTAENGGPRLVAYQGRNTEMISATPESTPTKPGAPPGGQGAGRGRPAGSRAWRPR